MTQWLIPLALFWPLAAMYLGGAEIRIEGGGGLRQLAGLLLHMVLFLAAWGGLRAGVAAVVPGGPVYWLVPAVLSMALLPLLGRFAFRIVGVRLIPTGPHADAHG